MHPKPVRDERRRALWGESVNTRGFSSFAFSTVDTPTSHGEPEGKGRREGHLILATCLINPFAVEIRYSLNPSIPICSNTQMTAGGCDCDYVL